jgi:YHS domain-containing protein
MTRFTALSLLSFALVACGGSTPAPQTPAPAPAPSSSSDATATKAPGEAKIGDHSKCPVSGEDFVVDASSPHAEHNGKTYYFCCPGCMKKFQADPAKYTNKT